jgi:EAL domain-containing protein (putative c-di-GMP-specific phosphodiesterase class I)/ActR/RegA family two-component response regulator
MKTAVNELSVLVADDSVTQRMHAQSICTELGLKDIHGAKDGRDALKLLLENNVDVALIDLEMPIMDGVELLRSIAQEKCVKSVIILSAKDPILIASVGTMAEADGLHVLGTFQKPLQRDLLETSLLRYVRELKTADVSDPTPQSDITVIDFCNALDAGDITLAYQPKLTVQGLILRGVEALARWKHPQKGNISPGIFIPLAERHGLIDKLTRELLVAAFKQKQEWQQYGFRFHLAFNLSPLSLADSDLSDWLFDLAQQYGIPREEITLEVTENALLGELACAIRTLARLRLKGFNVAIDDYGTGFANAQQLSRVPATELKIDRSLIHQVSTRPQQRTILASTVDLAKKLNLITVAEGVETLEDYKILIELGVDQVQGFYFSKPLFPNDLLGWIKTGLSKMRRQVSDT